MIDLRLTGQVAEVLHQADDPPLRVSQQPVEALVSLGGTGSGRRRTVIVVAC
jgi:hypothetical protein